MRRFLFVAVLLAPIQAQETVRVVSSGRWHQKGKSTTLVRDQQLADSEPLIGSKESGDLILQCPRQGLLMFSCSADCEARACLREQTKDLKVQQPLIAHVQQLFALLLKREPAELAVAGVRAAGGPNDAVVMQTAQGVHWGPALNRVLEGRYCFRLTHLPASGGAAREFTLDWDRSVEKEGIAAVPNLARGLYRFEEGRPAANGACRIDAGSAAAWVLVTPQARFAAIDKQWEDDSAKIDDLEQSGTSTSALMALRHGVLAGLADSVEGK
jgi:hypothetical protein